MTAPHWTPSPMLEVAKADWRTEQLEHRPAPPSLAMWPIKVFRDDRPVITGDGAFIWLIPEDLDGHVLTKVEAFVSTVGTGATQVQLRKVGVGDMLTTKITIDSGEKNSKDATTQPVVDTGSIAQVAWGDHISFDVDAVGDGAMGLGVYCYFLASPDSVAQITGPAGSVGPAGPQGDTGEQGPQGPAGGIVNWMGEWDSGTTYSADDAVSHNGASYVAIQGSTDVEPGVDAGWQDYWMVLAEGIGTVLQVWRGESTASDFDFSSTSYVDSGFPNDSSFTKISDTSLLWFSLNADFTTNNTAANVIYLAVFLDGSLYQAEGRHSSVANAFFTNGIHVVKGEELPAGAYDFTVRVALQVGGSNATLRCAAAVDFTIIEIEPGGGALPGGVINWTGEWDSGTTYSTDDAVSWDGASYVARQESTNVEPGVDAGWEDYWMLLASSAAAAPEMGVKLKKSSGQSITTGTWTLVTWDQEDFDSAGFHSTVSNTGRITIPSGGDGRYLVVLSIAHEQTGGSNTTAAATVFLNDSSDSSLDGTPLGIDDARPYVSGFGNTLIGTAVADLVEGDIIRCWFYKDSGATGVSVRTQSRLTAIRLHA